MIQFCTYCMNDTECTPTKKEVVFEYDNTPLKFEKKGYICSECKNFIEGDMYDYNVVCGNNEIKTKVIKDQQEEIKGLEGILEIGRKREFHSKFLKDFQKERGKNVFPDHDEIYKRYDDYKSRVDRAVEYIEDELWEIGGHVNGSDLMYDKTILPLLDILKGSDK